VSEHDAKIVYAALLLLHGYVWAAEQDKSSGRRVLLTNDRTAYGLDTSHDGLALVSVPVFWGRLVERIAAEASGHWDDSLIKRITDSEAVHTEHITSPLTVLDDLR
jgi:hypothetical protein